MAFDSREFNKILVKRLKYLRSINGFTQQKIADALRIERSTYSYYETGKSQPSLETLVRLCNVYDISLYDMMGCQLNIMAGCKPESAKGCRPSIENFVNSLTKEDMEKFTNILRCDLYDRVDMLIKNLRKTYW